MRKSNGCALALFCLLVLGCSTASLSETKHNVAPIIGGALDSSHSDVVAVKYTFKDELCSGVLITEKIVLTAGHCIWGIEPDSMYIVTESIVDEQANKLGVERIILYPGAEGNDSDTTGGTDLAALVLSNSVAGAGAPLIDSILPIIDHELVTMVGYGDTSSSGAGSGTRMAVQTDVRNTCERWISAGDESHNVCGGDSGGGVYYNNQLIALVSGGRSGCNTPAILVRLDTKLEWLNSLQNGDLDAHCKNCERPDSDCGDPGALVAQGGAGSGGNGGTSNQDAAQSTDSSAEGCDIARSQCGEHYSFGLGWVLGIGIAIRRKVRPQTVST